MTKSAADRQSRRGKRKATYDPASKKLTLAQICSIYNTDKNCLHSYVDHLYEGLFADRRDSTRKVLEIGVECGGSMLMWSEYFPNANIIGIDTKDASHLNDRDRVETIRADAYVYDTLGVVPDDLDIIIDDGPHTLETITFVVLEYTKKLNTDGVMVIEDFQDFNWTNIIKRLIDEEFEVDVKDFRRLKNRYDDIAMVIRRR